MYTVNGVSYESFDEVELIAWNMFKICPFPDDDCPTEEQRHAACRELERIIENPDILTGE